MLRPLTVLFTALAPALLWPQIATVRPASQVELPAVIDGNSAGFWAEGEFRLFHSNGVPTISRGADQFQLGPAEPVYFDAPHHTPVWFEAVWRDEVEGILFLWYHHEPKGVCAGSDITAPVIGAAISYDNGRTVKDLGIVLQAGDAIDCRAKNGFFGAGHGDFSVVLDRDKQHFYLLFGNYGGPALQQGVAIARMAFADRFQPVGAVQKYHNGEWTEPGLSGRVTPIFPVVKSWQREDTDAFWGPSVHWNPAVASYVVLLNRACCKPRWPMEGAYISFNADISNPSGWAKPGKILDQSQINNGSGYYAQVLGLGPGETDSLAGEVSRLYTHGVSRWELVLRKSEDAEPDPPVTDDDFCRDAFCTLP